MSGFRRWHFFHGSQTGRSHTHTLINTWAAQHPMKFIHVAKYTKIESLWWFLAYEIPFLFTNTLYRLTEEHKKVEVTVKPKITRVPLLMGRQTLKIQWHWEPKQTLKCLAGQPHRICSWVCYALSQVLVSAHCTESKSLFCIAAGNSETLMLSILGT